MFYKPKLLGGSVEWDSDLSAAGCSCNETVQLVSMPDVDINGKSKPGMYGDYYCDANGTSGNYCSELDLMEANTYAYQFTPHLCENPNAPPG